jgi:hypothetical protein
VVGESSHDSRAQAWSSSVADTIVTQTTNRLFAERKKEEMDSLEIQVRRRQEPQETMTLKFDGEEFEFTPPSDGQIMLALSSTSDGADPREAISALLLFLKGTLEPEAYTHLRGVLNDSSVEDPMDVLMDLFQGMIEAVSGDPTSSSSDSTNSPARTGARSTAPSRAKASTPSASRRAGSQTSSTSASRRT